jgi:hypothetical protein
MPLRRLTRDQYDNTVRDLLGDTTRPARAFPADEDLLGFDTGATVSPLLVELYMNAAETLAATAVADLGALLPCDPALSGEETCARGFIQTFGRRAYRRPLAPEQVDRLMAVFGSAAAATFADRIRLVLTAMLQSPFFLYRVETAPGTPGGPDVVRLDGHEVATRLSYLLWNTMPDDELFAAAEAGELGAPEQVAAHARRMLDDEQARPAIASFFDQWLEIASLDEASKDTELFPEFNAAMRRSMRGETRAFVEHVLFEGDGRLHTLFTAPYTFADARLAELYGIEGVTGDAFVQVDTDPGERAGLLTHASLLATHALANQSSPVLRGKYVRERLLCQPIPPPPDGLMVVAPDPAPGLSTRERWAAHSTDPSCSGCHRLMDPIGFGFEHYDAIGQYREMDDGRPVDARGELLAAGDVTGAFEGVPELAERLAASPEVADCMTAQWFQFALGRPEVDDDGCSLSSLADVMEASGGDVRELIVAIVSTDAFLYRRAAPGEEVSP